MSLTCSNAAYNLEHSFPFLIGICKEEKGRREGMTWRVVLAATAILVA